MVPPGPKKASGGNGETEIFLDVPGEFLGMLKREKSGEENGNGINLYIFVIM